MGPGVPITDLTAPPLPALSLAPDGRCRRVPPLAIQRKTWQNYPAIKSPTLANRLSWQINSRTSSGSVAGSAAGLLPKRGITYQLALYKLDQVSVVKVAPATPPDVRRQAESPLLRYSPSWKKPPQWRWGGRRSLRCRRLTISATYAWLPGVGRCDNPTRKHVEALADFLGVPAVYFFDGEATVNLAVELGLLNAMNTLEVKTIAFARRWNLYGEPRLNHRGNRPNPGAEKATQKLAVLSAG